MKVNLIVEVLNDLYHQMFMSFFTVRLRLQPEVVVYLRLMFIGPEKDAKDSENTSPTQTASC